jgi:CheY-like chemotaxis protein
MKVLVVEDEELLRAAAVEALEEAGFQVIEATTGEEAIRKCQEPLDALFTDIRVAPERGGKAGERGQRCPSPVRFLVSTTCHTFVRRSADMASIASRYS